MKLCNRNYAKGSLLTTKMIDGIACCPSCNKPTICHNKPIEQRVLFWALSGDTGISSETMAAYFTGNPAVRYTGAPSDGADRGRCIRLLELVPEWIERLDELKQLDRGTIAVNGANPIPRSQDTHSWTYQIPLIIQEGKL